MRFIFLIIFHLMFSMTFGQECDHSWSKFTSIQDLEINGIKFSEENVSYIGRCEAFKGLTSGRIEISSSPNFISTFGSKVKRIVSNFEYLKSNENYTYTFVNATLSKYPNNAVSVGDTWMIGRTLIDEFYYPGKVGIGTFGLYYEDTYGKVVLTDNYEILSCHANPLKNLFKKIYEENLNLKSDQEILQKDLKRASKNKIDAEKLNQILDLEVEKLASINFHLMFEKEELFKSVTELNLKIENLTETSRKLDKTVNDKITTLELERDSLMHQNEDNKNKLKFCGYENVEIIQLRELNESLSEENQNLNRQLMNIRSEYDDEIQRLKEELSQLRQKVFKGEPPQNCNSDNSDQIEVELKILNFQLIEMQEYIASVKIKFKSNNTKSNPILNSVLDDFSVEYEEIFSNEKEINCEVNDDEICIIESFINRHFNTQLNGIYVRKTLNNHEMKRDDPNPYEFIDPDGFSYNPYENNQNEPQLIENSPTITEIIIRDQILWFIPQKLGKLFPNLTTFSIINSNLLKLINKDFEDMTNLKVLKIIGNHLSHVNQKAFESLKSLEELELSFNKIETIDEGAFVKLENLQTISLENNEIEKISSDLFYMKSKLKQISFARNKIKHLDGNFIERLRNFESFDLSGNECIDLIIHPSISEEIISKALNACKKI